MSRWNLKMSKYGISNKRYKELCGFCEQYPEWKAELALMTHLKAVRMTGMPHGTGTGDPTANMAIKREKLEGKVTLIEETAKEASPELWKWIIKSVCYGTPYRFLDVPSSDKPFYTQRRYFFYLLDKRKG